MPAATPPRRHPVLFGAALVIALAALAVGAVVAYRGATKTLSPPAVVRGYFAALARSDASAALGYAMPPGADHALLTSTVLAEQQRIAPIRDVAIGPSSVTADTARVGVRYALGFADGAVPITTTIALRKAGGDWRLASAAVPTAITVNQAAERATLAGAPIPGGTVALFPGAVPIRFDTPYLQLQGTEDHIDFGGDASLSVLVEASAAGKSAMLTAVRAALAGCLRGGADADPRCPMRRTTDVPGSLRGTLVGALTKGATVSVGGSDAGVLQVTGSASVRGRYATLSFVNTVSRKSGTFQVDFTASAYAVGTLKIIWGGTS